MNDSGNCDDWEITRTALLENRHNENAELLRESAAIDADKQLHLQRQIRIVIRQLHILAGDPRNLSLTEVVHTALQFATNETAAASEALHERQLSYDSKVYAFEMTHALTDF